VAVRADEGTVVVGGAVVVVLGRTVVVVLGRCVVVVGLAFADVVAFVVDVGAGALVVEVGGGALVVVGEVDVEPTVVGVELIVPRFSLAGEV
jgi:hypothetical protein